MDLAFTAQELYGSLNWYQTKIDWRDYKWLIVHQIGRRSEVINAGPLPENPFLTHQPHDSFDGNGYLKSDALSALDQIKAQPVFALPPPSQLQQLPEPPVPPRSAPYLIFDRECHELTSELVDEAVQEECEEMAEQLALEAGATNEVVEVNDAK